MALPTDLSCTVCDEDRLVDVGDVSYGDYMQAEMHECTHCDGDRISLCESCEENTATHKDQWVGRLCDECDKGWADQTAQERYEEHRAEERQERIDTGLQG